LKKKKKKKKSAAKKIWIAILLVLVLAGGFTATFALNKLVSPMQSESQTQIFAVNQGDSVKTVLKNLQQEGFIRETFVSGLYIKYLKLEDVKLGNYELDKSWSVQEIFETLNDPTAALPVDVKITIPEGTWAKGIAQKVAANTSVTEEELLALWNDDAYLRSLMNEYEFLTEDILNDELRVKLEGYLFPDTYFFYVVTTPEAVTKKFLDQTNVIYQKYKEDFDASEYSIHEIFTLASMTQFEAGSDAYNGLVSGVWFNRLKSGMKLQSSVTVCYALYNYEHWKDCEVNPDIDSPFNTYKYAGIPIGPIDNPGESAIASVLHPTDSKYLYFIADVYGDGQLYFAETYAQHQENIRKYLEK
jgi:UPF0755 protein